MNPLPEGRGRGQGKAKRVTALGCGANDARVPSIRLQLDNLIGAAELCVQKVQAASMAEKSIGERCRREANVSSPAPGEIVLRELKLDVMKFNPVSLSSPSDGLPVASEKDTERFCQCHGKERVLRAGVQKRGLEAARSHGTPDANGHDRTWCVVVGSGWCLLC